ncbi:MAG: type VI secretion system baseplate subunit TssG [Gammaproteobacteria bacterium]|nr:MAG: type VI secretion system baseplate subunit TssG [Gammaproteobacteria bacterium]
MSTTGRRKNTSVISRLTEAPHDFPFLQAVRLLERSAAFEINGDNSSKKEKHQYSFNKQPVGIFTPPNTEVIRFSTNPALNFSSSEIHKISKSSTKNKKNKWDLSVNFMGLAGAQGVLPYHYTEMLLKRHKLKDESLSHFLNLFNHRIISLFYQASNKYKLPIEYERKKLNPPKTKKRDDHSQVLLSLIGLGTKNLNNRLYIRDESLFYYSGLLSQQVKTTSGLKQILRSYFNIPVEINEFVGQWQELIEDVRTRLPGKELPSGQNNCLGRSVMLGRKGWFAQGKINIVLGPLNKEQLQIFSPGTKALKALNEIVQIYAGMEYSYDFIIKVKRRDIPKKIHLSKKSQPVMGWNTWLSTQENSTFDNEETVDIKVSASRVN